MTTTPTVAEFTAWAKAHTELALTVCKAQAMAELKRETVDAYIKPVFLRFEFREPDGTRIFNPKLLYLCEDEERIAEYFAACDVEHRKRGFTGPTGHCPALIMENLHTQAENCFLQAGCDFFGLKHIPYNLDHREKMLKLLLGACLKSATPAQTRL